MQHSEHNHTLSSLLYLPVFCLLWISSCTSYPAGVRESLALAGANKREIQKVLTHYRQQPQDSLKYKAACFLIEHMKWHGSSRIITPDTSFLRLLTTYNRFYTDAIKDKKDDQLESGELYGKIRQYNRQFAETVREKPLRQPESVYLEMSDLQFLSSGFLISHIDNAFDVWENSPYISNLDYQSFLEYILPYRSIAGYPYYENGKKIRDIFGKYLEQSSGQRLEDLLLRYNHYIDAVREVFGSRQEIETAGFYDLFINNGLDCIPIANNTGNVFRACGIPVRVEHNLSYRAGIGRHYYCSFRDYAGNWHRFDARVTYNSTRNPLTQPSVNIYESTFAAQEDTPYFLKNDGEKIPGEFSTPCLRDVTSNIYEVAEINIPFPESTGNKLAYLYHFYKDSTGLAPSTWGVIDHDKGRATFKNVLYDVLYFPVYFKNSTISCFADPFYLTKPETQSEPPCFHYLSTSHTVHTTGTLLLRRKFPVKAQLAWLASRFAGTRIEGANRSDFSDAQTIYTIKEAPRPYLQVYQPERSQPFRYFRYILPNTGVSANSIRTLELLVSPVYATEDFPPASRLPAYAPEEVSLCPDTGSWLRLTTTQTDRLDGGRRLLPWPVNHTIKLKNPVKVEKILFEPVNAGNHIVPGNRYELMFWDNGWKSAGIEQAQYHFVAFDDIPLHRLYWLKNLDEGREELPFLYRNGKQLFIYHDTIP